MTSGHDVSEYSGTLGLVKSYFFKFFAKKIEKKIHLGAPTPLEDEVICLFAGLIPNPDMPLSLKLTKAKWNQYTTSCYLNSLQGCLP